LKRSAETERGYRDFMERLERSLTTGEEIGSPFVHHKADVFRGVEEADWQWLGATSCPSLRALVSNLGYQLYLPCFLFPYPLDLFVQSCLAAIVALVTV
jgi:hypothetical protein